MLPRPYCDMKYPASNTPSPPARQLVVFMSAKAVERRRTGKRSQTIGLSFADPSPRDKAKANSAEPTTAKGGFPKNKRRKGAETTKKMACKSRRRRGCSAA